MPSSGPLPQTVEDGVVNALKDSFADHVPVIVGPAPYFGIQPIDQLGGRQAQGGFDYLPDAVQEDFHILLGGLDEQFPDRKSTRLNSSHGYISYAVFCLKKK